MAWKTVTWTKIMVYSDNQNVIHICKNPIFHKRSKHTSVKYHFIREVVSKYGQTKEELVSKFRVCKNLLNIEVGWIDEAL